MSALADDAVQAFVARVLEPGVQADDVRLDLLAEGRLIAQRQLAGDGRATVATVAELLGQKSPAMVHRYSHLSTNHLRGFVELPAAPPQSVHAAADTPQGIGDETNRA